MPTGKSRCSAPMGTRLAATPPNVGNTIFFAGETFDTSTGLYFDRARYYDPQLGRFISEDPIGYAGSGANLYAYCGDNPTDATDPFGTQIRGRPIGIPVGRWFSHLPDQFELSSRLTGTAAGYWALSRIHWVVCFAGAGALRWRRGVKYRLDYPTPDGDLRRNGPHDNAVRIRADNGHWNYLEAWPIAPGQNNPHIISGRAVSDSYWLTGADVRPIGSGAEQQPAARLPSWASRGSIRTRSYRATLWLTILSPTCTDCGPHQTWTRLATFIRDFSKRSTPSRSLGRPLVAARIQ